MKQLVIPTIACVLVLVGCGVRGNTPALHPSLQTEAASNSAVVPSTPKLPSPPTGMTWFAVTVGGQTYDYPAKSQQNTQFDGLLADTKYGVAWTNPSKPDQILLSPPDTSVLNPPSAKVLFTCTLPYGLNSTEYTCAAGTYDVSSSLPDTLFWGEYISKKSNPTVSTLNIHALNLKTGKDQVVMKNARNGGGFLYSVAYHNHYFFYYQASPTATDYLVHAHVVDLNTGKDRLFWTGQLDKMPHIKVQVDDETYIPMWKPYGTHWTQTEPE